MTQNIEKTPHTQKLQYVIQVGAQLDQTTCQRFPGLAVRNLENGQAQLVGVFEDQPALFGILLRLRDLNIPLISLHPLD